MNSWHFLDGHLILVTGPAEDRLRAMTVDEGHIVSCELKPGSTFPTFDRSGSAKCQDACVDAIMQRRSKTGFRQASDVMAKLTNRYGDSTHEVEGLAYKVEREANGDFVASVNYHFDTISLRLATDGSLQEPTGSRMTGGFDPQVEKIYQVMRRLLGKRRDWELSSRLSG
jgi:hypothetical protein